MVRDFTYIDDIITGIIGAVASPATPDDDWGTVVSNPNTSFAPYRLYNLGNHQPTTLNHFISCIESAVGKQAVKNLMPIQPGDVKATAANIDTARQDLNFAPTMPIEQGIKIFVDWYRLYHQIPVSAA